MASLNEVSRKVLISAYAIGVRYGRSQWGFPEGVNKACGLVCTGEGRVKEVSVTPTFP